VKNTLPLDSILIMRATKGVNQDNIVTITNNEKTMSKARFNKRLSGSYTGIVLNVSIGIS